MNSLPMKAFWLGILSAVSLPLGAIFGLIFHPPKKLVASIMAFGAGSLIAALTIELVTPAIEKHAGYWPMALGAVIGGVMFASLNQVVNYHGGFLRKSATIMRHLFKTKKALYKEIIDDLSNVNILRSLPPSEVKMLIPYVNQITYSAESIIFEQNELGDSLYFIKRGKVEVIKDKNVIAQLSDGATFGEMSILSGEPRNATLRAVTEVSVWKIFKDDFDKLIHISSALLDAVQELNLQRQEENIQLEEEAKKQWTKEVMKQVNSSSLTYTERDVQEEIHKHTNKKVGLAIFLGILLDGIPESAVIGASLIHHKVSMALIAGLFLSNLPESMSSAINMKKQGSSVLKIMSMWIFLTVMTGVGSLLGNILFEEASSFWFALFEGCAAGAMLAMVAETMLPEAYEQGGAVVGLSTLFGFLSAYLIKYGF